MTAGLAERERIREAFGTYVDRDVAEHILQGAALQADELEVTLMFVDVRSFTTFAERVRPIEVVAALNRLFERIVPLVHRHGGHVDKYAGDGLFAVFGAPRTVCRSRRSGAESRLGDLRRGARRVRHGAVSRDRVELRTRSCRKRGRRRTIGVLGDRRCRQHRCAGRVGYPTDG